MTSGASMNTASTLSPDALNFDELAEADRIARWIVDTLSKTLHRRGLVVAISGGIDSSVCAALAVRALGPGKVFGLLMPERDSSGFSTERGLQLARHLGTLEQPPAGWKRTPLRARSSTRA